ncbi:MAG: type II toxin-antitoxin system HicB family antitoxin [Acidobacteria bacterium]|nr:type II toxin-antitoxin system HicB family antitoxin [Acidobacteriota bacterium]
MPVIFEREVYAALCPDFDIVSRGTTTSRARENVREALDLFFEQTSREER